MKSRRTIAALCAFFVAIAVVVAGCGSSGSIPSGSVASVAGNPISKQAYQHWFYVTDKGLTGASGGPTIIPDPPNYTNCVSQAKAAIAQLKKAPDATVKKECATLDTELNQRTMQSLIFDYWYQAEAHKQGLSVTPAQIAKTLTKERAAQYKSDAAFDAFLKQSGYTKDDINYEIRVTLLLKKLLKKYPTKVTSKDISTYYSAHKSSFGTPETRNMRIVLAKTSAKAKQALSALKKGQSWTAVAKKYSIDPTTKNKGGLLTDVSQGTQDAALTKAAFAAPLNKLQGPVKGQFGYYVVQVIKINAATQQSLKTVTPQIKQTLVGLKQKSAQTAVENKAKQDFSSRTLCESQYAVTGCKGYKAPAASTAGAGSTATAPPSGSTTPATGGAGSTTPAGGSASSTTTSSTSSK